MRGEAAKVSECWAGGQRASGTGESRKPRATSEVTREDRETEKQDREQAHQEHKGS